MSAHPPTIAPHVSHGPASSPANGLSWSSAAPGAGRSCAGAKVSRSGAKFAHSRSGEAASGAASPSPPLTSIPVVTTDSGAPASSLPHAAHEPPHRRREQDERAGREDRRDGHRAEELHHERGV